MQKSITYYCNLTYFAFPDVFNLFGLYASLLVYASSIDTPFGFVAFIFSR